MGRLKFISLPGWPAMLLLAWAVSICGLLAGHTGVKNYPVVGGGALRHTWRP
jgi:hypothetical protein